MSCPLTLLASSVLCKIINISDKDIQDYTNSPEQRKAFEKAVESEVASLMEQKTTLAEAGVYSTPEIDAKIASLEKALHAVADEGSKVDKAAYEKAKQKLEDERRDALNDLKAMGDI